jgi:hypothetical protein
MLALQQALVAAFKSLLLPGNISFGLLAIVAAVIAGPFDTLSRLTLAERIMYWSGVVVFSVFTATLAQKLLSGYLRGASEGLAILLDSAVLTVLFSPIAYFWTLLFFEDTPVLRDRRKRGRFHPCRHECAAGRACHLCHPQACVRLGQAFRL